MDELQERSILSLQDLLALLNEPGGERRFDDIECSVGGILPDTPPHFHLIAHYAAVWGIGDDGYRGDFVAGAPEWLRRNLKWVVEQHEDALMEWLAGPEAENPHPTTAYVAFTCLIMAAEEGQANWTHVPSQDQTLH